MRDTVKFIEIRSIIIRFFINSILLQDIAKQVFFNRKWHCLFDQLSAQILLLQTCKQKWNTNWKWKPNFFFFKNLSLASFLHRFTPPLSTLPLQTKKLRSHPNQYKRGVRLPDFRHDQSGKKYYLFSKICKYYFCWVVFRQNSNTFNKEQTPLVCND